MTTRRQPRRRHVPRPFLKWAGGKSQILEDLRRVMPERYARYHEPFVGGGALFFDARPTDAVLSDSNRELIDCYIAIRDETDRVIAELKTHPYDRDHYYEVRGWEPDLLEPAVRAARMIYLNKSGFNGLYRVNSRGRFNVPFGRYGNRTICDEENLRACAAALAGVEILCAPFETVLDRARPGDLVYFDPPYIPLSRTASFTAYQRDGFDMECQERLARVFDELARRGVLVMLSNADVPWMHEMYRSYRIHSVQARRSVNSDTSRRGPVSELIVTSY